MHAHEHGFRYMAYTLHNLTGTLASTVYMDVYPSPKATLSPFAPLDK